MQDPRFHGGLFLQSNASSMDSQLGQLTVSSLESPKLIFDQFVELPGELLFEGMIISLFGSCASGATGFETGRIVGSIEPTMCFQPIEIDLPRDG